MRLISCCKLGFYLACTCGILKGINYIHLSETGHLNHSRFSNLTCQLSLLIDLPLNHTVLTSFDDNDINSQYNHRVKCFGFYHFM